MDWNEIIRITTVLLAIINPISSMPVFLSFTSNIKNKRSQVAGITAFSVALILILFTLFGELILIFFNISVSSFRVAGGILIMMTALNMLAAKQSMQRNEVEDEEAIESTSVAVVPLALPLLAGPGAMSSMILFSSQTPDWSGKLTLLLIVIVVSIFTWLVFLSAPQISKRISTSSMNIMTRIMGLILAAMAIEFITGGLKNLLPGLSG